MQRKKPRLPKIEVKKKHSSESDSDSPRKGYDPRTFGHSNIQQHVEVNVIMNEPEDDMLDKCCAGCLNLFKKGATAAGGA